MSDTVSVVIPTCNRSDLVSRAVKSALAQTHAEMEVVVVVDGPDQATELALQSVNDPRLKIIVLPERSGGSGARNKGVEYSTGEWIAFLDDDDEWFPEKIEKQLHTVRMMDAEFPVLTSRIVARTPRCDYIWPKRLKSPDEHISDYLFVRRSPFYGESLLPTPTILTKRELLLRVPFTVGLKKHQDWDWYLRVARVKGVSFQIHPEPLAIVHWDEPRVGISSSNMWQYSLEWIRDRKDLVTERAYAAFVVTQVGNQAANQSEYSVFLLGLKEMFKHGRPRLFDIIMYLGLWLVPRNTRHRLRALLSRERA